MHTDDAEIYTLSLHDALPISTSYRSITTSGRAVSGQHRLAQDRWWPMGIDRKSTRLNSSHRCISYAVFCLKKKITSDKRRKELQQTETLNHIDEQIHLDTNLD